MSNPIVVSGSMSEKVALPDGEYRFRCSKVDTKEGKDMEGNPVTKIRFHFRTNFNGKDAYATTSVNAKLNERSRLYAFLKAAAPKEFRGPAREDATAAWKLCQDIVGREFTLEIQHKDGWNNIVEILEAHGKTQKDVAAEQPDDDDVEF